MLMGFKKSFSDYGLSEEFEFDSKELDNKPKFVKKIKSYYVGGNFYSTELEILKYVKKRIKSHLEAVRDIAMPGRVDNFLYVINWIDTEILKLQVSGISREVPVKVRVLYYYYLHRSGELPNFNEHPNGITKAIKEVAEEHNIGVGSFTNYRYKLSRKDYRITRRNISHAEHVIELLEEYPLAKVIAKAELILMKKEREKFILSF